MKSYKMLHLILHCFTLLYMSAAHARDLPCHLLGPDEWTVTDLAERTLNGTPKRIRDQMIARCPIDPETGKAVERKEYVKVEERFEDDLEDPKYRPPSESPVLTDCASSEDCREQIVTCQTQRPDPIPEGWECNTDINTCPVGEGRPRFDAKSNWPDIEGDGWFIWCEKVIGYEQKRVPHYTVDLDEKHRIEREEKEKADAEKAKRERQNAGRDKRLSQLQQCLSLVPGASDGQIVGCIHKLTKDRMIDHRRQPEDEEPVE